MAEPPIKRRRDLLARAAWPLLPSPRPLARRRLSLQIERLEDRFVMDAGWVHTDPTPDPGSVVGPAGVIANDDYVRAAPLAEQLRIDVLSNDLLPSGSAGLKIKSVSATARGATVAISDDGLRLLYTPPADAGYDSFYYIVEDENGKLGKANVTVNFQHDATTWVPSPERDDYYEVLEDSGEITLEVLANDADFAGGEIIAITAPSQEGALRIADDGKSLLYHPKHGVSGREQFQYTVRNSAGEMVTHRVSVIIHKPYDALYDSAIRLNIGSGPVIIQPLANDFQRAATPDTPRIVSVTQPPLGVLRISDDGQHLVFEPADAFIGSFSYSYTVAYGPEDHQRVSSSGYVTVHNTFLAVDDWRLMDAGAAEQPVDVLKNDPVFRRYDLPDVTLRIVAVSAGSHGGAATIADDGRTILYTPATGFLGAETFTYELEDSTGHRDSAVVTLHVAEPTPDPAGVPRFSLPGELEHFLIDQAVKQYMSQFGLVHEWYHWGPTEPVLRTTGWAFMAADGMTTSSHSTTNTQVAGVDEADIVETDGRYLYTFAEGKLAIVDLADPANPVLVSLTKFDDSYSEMYLQGNRVTLINRGDSWNAHGKAIVTVLNIADRAHPVVQERTEIDGRIIDTRAVGDRVHVATSGLRLPDIERITLVEAENLGAAEVGRYETLDEYISRVRSTLVDSALPQFRTYDAAGKLLRTGLLTALTDIHKPIDSIDTSLLSLAIFDVANNTPGPDASSAIFTSAASEVYMSADACYVLRSHGSETAVFKFATPADGAPTLAAVGKVKGALLNQFSVDEHEGRLRIATTDTQFEETSEGWRRQLRRANNLYILEQVGAGLVVVGSVENLAPTETIKSVRFMGDRAYVVTFRVVDPLFAIDLSDPTAPVVKGSLKIPGYSDYLHPVGENYVIGIGRDADEITGQTGAPQISLFYVGDLTSPQLVDQVTMEGAQWADSEALADHHAVSYFAEYGMLAIPVSWNEPIDVDQDGDGFLDFRSWQTHSAIWAFEIEVDQSGGGSIETAGRINHEGNARRSVRIGDHLVTISDVDLKVHDINDLGEQVGELYLGSLAAPDTFTVEEDSGPTTLDVRANDRPGSSASQILSVTQPIAGSIFWWVGGSSDGELAGSVAISADGQSLIFTPKENFFGVATFKYTLFDSVRGEMEATVTIHVENVVDDPLAAGDEFNVPVDSAVIRLDVLANDENPDHRFSSFHFGWNGGLIDVIRPITTFTAVLTPTLLLTESLQRPVAPALDADFTIFPSMVAGDRMLLDPIGLPFINLPALKITAVSPGSAGGAIEIDESGAALNYAPAPGFTGVETFTYTITTPTGRTATATVTVTVGDAAAEQTTLLAPTESPAESPGESLADSPQTPATASLPNLAARIYDEGTSLIARRAARPVDPSAATIESPTRSTPRQLAALSTPATSPLDALTDEALTNLNAINLPADLASDLSANFALHFE